MGRKAADDDDPNNNSSTRESLRKDNGESPCAICWDVIVVGRKLPCSHIFHRYTKLFKCLKLQRCRNSSKVSVNKTPAKPWEIFLLKVFVEVVFCASLEELESILKSAGNLIQLKSQKNSGIDQVSNHQPVVSHQKVIKY